MIHTGCGRSFRLRHLFHAGVGAVVRANRRTIWTGRRGQVLIVWYCAEHGTEIEIEERPAERGLTGAG